MLERPAPEVIIIVTLSYFVAATVVALIAVAVVRLLKGGRP